MPRRHDVAIFYIVFACDFPYFENDNNNNNCNITHIVKTSVSGANSSKSRFLSGSLSWNQAGTSDRRTLLVGQGFPSYYVDSNKAILAGHFCRYQVTITVNSVTNLAAFTVAYVALDSHFVTVS
jgi:hypothetical protein